jgi:hypothetical protein
MVLALALGACRSQAGGPADAGVVPEPVALTCAALLAPELREALPGFTLREERTCPTCAPLCTFRSQTPPDTTVSLAYDCKARYATTDVMALLAPTLRAGGQEIPALGRAAARRAPVPGMLQVITWDDDTPCALVVTWLGAESERAVDIARLALRTTTGDTLARALPPPPSDAGPGGGP